MQPMRRSINYYRQYYYTRNVEFYFIEIIKIRSFFVNFRFLNVARIYKVLILSIIIIPFVNANLYISCI